MGLYRGNIGIMEKKMETTMLFRVQTPKICKIIAFWALIRGLGLLFYILLVFR